MTIEEINKIIKNTEAKVSEIKSIVTDIDTYKNETSKTILLAAASKLASALSNAPATR